MGKPNSHHKVLVQVIYKISLIINHTQSSARSILNDIPEKWYPSRDPHVGPRIRYPSSGTWDARPILGTRDAGHIGGTRKPGSLRGARDLRPSTSNPFWNIHTPILAICHMKDYMERNNFDLRSAFWEWLLHVLNCIWKVLHKSVTFKREKLCEKVIHWIVATNTLARFRIVTHSCADSFSRKILLCETNNIFYSLANCVWHKINNIFWK